MLEKKLGAGNWEKAWRDNRFEVKIGQDGRISEPGTGPSTRGVLCRFPDFCNKINWESQIKI